MPSPEEFSWGAVAALAAAASAIFAALSAGANLYSTRSYQRQLRNGTIDACIDAATALRGAINRALQVKVKSADPAKFEAAYTQAWSAWRLFDQKLAVAKRYVSTDSYPEGVDKALAELLVELETAQGKESMFQQKAE